MRIKSFETYLREENLSENTVKSYVFSVETYMKMFKKINSRSIAEYKEYLVKHYQTQTVNLRLIGLSKYLKFLKKEKLRPKLIKYKKENFLQNVITYEDYEFLKESLKKDQQLKWYFIVSYLGATGVRVSEIVQFKIFHIYDGFADIHSKGGKIRRVYIPKNLQEETLSWLSKLGRREGPLFLNKNGGPISIRGLSFGLKNFARRYKIDEKTVHPHSFRHLFAKKFLEKSGDITFLADILGHESIDTTRIYLRKSTEEQQRSINSIVSW